MSQSTDTALDIFGGLDSILTTKDVNTIEINDDGSSITQSEDQKKADKIIAEKKANDKIIVEDTDLIEVDAITPNSTKTVSDTINKEVKETTSEKTTTTTINDDGTETVTEDTENVQALKEFAKALKQENVLENIDLRSFDGTMEGLTKAIENEAYVKANTMVDEYKETLPPIIKYLADNYEDGVPLDQLINIKSNEIRYSSIDTDKLSEDVSLQKEVYKQFLKETTNFSDTKIAKELTRLEETGEIANEASEALPELIKFEKQKESNLKAQTKAAQEKQEKANQEVLDTIKKRTTELKGKEIVPGLKLGDKEVKQLHKSMTTPIGYNKQGQPISEVQALREKDPIDFEMRFNYVFSLTKGFTDFSEITRKAKTQVINSLEKSTEGATTFKGGKSNIIDEETPVNILNAASKFIKSYKK